MTEISKRLHLQSLEAPVVEWGWEDDLDCG